MGFTCALAYPLARTHARAPQVAWHPHSEGHLLVLTSDNALRVYHLMDLSMAEQTLSLKVNSPDAAGAHAVPRRAAPRARPPQRGCPLAARAGREGSAQHGCT